MKQEIKFKIWDNSSKCFLSDIKLSSFCSNGTTLNALFNNTHFERWTFLRFTGVKDRRGNKIFEGDIVRIIINNVIDGIFVIKYFAPTMQFLMDTQFDEREFLQDHACYSVANKFYHGKLEVIGNYFENPQLLD